MKIGLFFGSFNPIHIGHLIIASHVSNFYTDQVWFVVSPQNPLKHNSQLLDANKRLELVSTAISENSSFIVCDIEFRLTIPSYTVNTLRAITTQDTDNQYFMIIGSDNFIKLPSWSSFSEIINNFNILVYERPDFPLTPFAQKNIQIMDSILLDISSTKVRDLIIQNKSIRYLVPENIRIQIEKYYK